MSQAAYTPRAFVNNVIHPTLCSLTEISYAAAAVELPLGTARVESGLRHRRQIGGGPALGLSQMEPNTHDDI